VNTSHHYAFYPRAVHAFGINLSPRMVEVARRDHPGLRFEVGSMTNLVLADASITGLVAWYSLIHIPDDELGSVFDHFQRVLRPGGPLLLGFHVGDESVSKTHGYGGHPIHLYVHRRQHSRMCECLCDAGFVVEARKTLTSAALSDIEVTDPPPSRFAGVAGCPENVSGQL